MSVRLVKGVLHTSNKLERGQNYTVKNSGNKAKKVLTRCDGVAKRFTYVALDPIPVDPSGDFDAVLTDDSIGLKISLNGEVKRHGKAVVGTIKTNKFKNRKQTCKAPKQKFKTSNK